MNKLIQKPTIIILITMCIQGGFGCNKINPPPENRIVYTNASEMPIKQSDVEINQTTRADTQQKQTVYDVEYSELTVNPEKYLGKVVRVKALIFKGPLADPRLLKEQVKSTWIGYDFAPNAKEAAANLEEAFGPDVYIPHKVVRCERALATVIGEFIEDANKTKENKKGGNKLSYQYWIIVNHLENIEACPKLWVNNLSAERF